MAESAEEAIASALNGVEAARRVGWARAYDYEDKLDGALKESNLFRGDRDAFRKGLSFMFGLFMEWSREDRSELFQQVMKEVSGYDAVLDVDLVKAGRRKARSIREFDAVYAEEQDLARAAKQSEKRERNNKYTRDWREAKERGVEAVAARYGFRSLQEMEGVLERWQQASGRKSIDPDVIREERRRREFDRRRSRRSSSGE